MKNNYAGGTMEIFNLEKLFHFKVIAFLTITLPVDLSEILTTIRHNWSPIKVENSPLKWNFTPDSQWFRGETGKRSNKFMNKLPILNEKTITAQTN